MKSLSTLNLAAIGVAAKRHAEPADRRLSGPVIGYAPPEPEIEAAPLTSLRPFRSDTRVLPSPLPNVTNEAWTTFVFAMRTQGRADVSKANGLGMFDIRYKRLADLKLVTNPRLQRDVVINRSVQVADWVAPLSRAAFLASAEKQLEVFTTSMVAYYADLRSGELRLPTGVSASGALAILHRGGRGALAKWDDQEQQFESTRELVRVANGVF